MSAELREAAEALMFEYAASIDEGRFADWMSLFAEEASYQVLSRENVDLGLPAPLILCEGKDMIRDRILSLENANEYNPHYDRHLVGRVRITARGVERWQLDASYAVYHTTQDGVSRLFSVGRYCDQVKREGGRLLFTDKRVIVDTFSVPTLLATPL